MGLKWKQSYFNQYFEWNSREKNEFISTVESLGFWYYVKKSSPYPEIELQFNSRVKGNRKLKGYKIILKDNGEIMLGFPDDTGIKNERKIYQDAIKRLFSLYQETLGVLYDIGIAYFEDEKNIPTAGDEIDLLSAELIRSIKEYVEQGYCPDFAKSILKKTIIEHEELLYNDELREFYKRVTALPEEPQNIYNPKW